MKKIWNILFMWIKNYIEGRNKMYIVAWAIFVIGGAFLEIVWMEWHNFEIKEILVSLAMGIPLFLGGCLLLFNDIGRAFPNKEEREAAKKEEELKEYPLTKALHQFRTILADFFRNSRMVENDAIQGFVTQSYFRVLSLQKRRLLKKGMALELTSRQKQHGEDLPLIWEHGYDDGKYRIVLSREQISAVKTFCKEGKKLYQRKENEVAEYTLLTAFRRGGDNIVCPSCGNTTTRENLLDGCDFCKSKFSVEDLGERVQSFAFGSDYGVEYEKYKRIRKKIWHWATMLGGVPGVLLVLVVSVQTFFELWRKGEGVGPFIAILGSMLAAVLFGALSAAIVFVLLWFVLYPIVQGMMGLRYLRKKYLQEAKEREKRNKEAETAVKSYDGRFSLQGFYGNLQNKLAGIHFAENSQEINAFSDCDLSSYLPLYQNVVDMEVEFMRLDDYFIENQIQHAKVSAILFLLHLEGDRINRKKEQLKLHLVKSALCKTQAVTGPEITRCKGCGATLLLLEGKQCQYCGSHIPMFEHDWVIVGYGG